MELSHSTITQGNQSLSKWHEEKWKSSLLYIKDGQAVLDIGCSSCGFFHYLAQHRSCKMQGFDTDLEAVKNAKQQGISVSAQLEDITESFDVITLWEIIEHLPVETFIHYLQWISHHIHPGGVVLISTPNILNIFYPFWAEPTHIRPYDMGNLVRLLQSQGFSVVSQEFTHKLRHPLKRLFCACMNINPHTKLFVACTTKLK